MRLINEYIRCIYILWGEGQHVHVHESRRTSTQSQVVPPSRLRYIDTVFEKIERVIRICLKFQNLFKDLF